MGREMRVLMSTYGSRGAVEPLVALAVRLRELAAEVRVCAPPDCAERPAEGCHALGATGVMPTGAMLTGVWR
jgi:Glycosyltransferase family 28 N-terminal domain